MRSWKSGPKMGYSFFFLHCHCFNFVLGFGSNNKNEFCLILNPEWKSGCSHTRPPAQSLWGGSNFPTCQRNVQCRNLKKKHRKNCECCPFHFLFKGHYEVWIMRLLFSVARNVISVSLWDSHRPHISRIGSFIQCVFSMPLSSLCYI